VTLGKDQQHNLTCSQYRNNYVHMIVVWFPDPSIKPRTDPRGKVWANDLTATA